MLQDEVAEKLASNFPKPPRIEQNEKKVLLDQEAELSNKTEFVDENDIEKEKPIIWAQPDIDNSVLYFLEKIFF